MLPYDNPIASHVVRFDPPDIAGRQIASWRGMHADTVQVTRYEPFAFSFHAPFHLLIASERDERYDGEALIDGLSPSSLRSFSGKLTLVPAGCRFHGWQKPRALTRMSYFYIDPKAPLLDPGIGFARATLHPRMSFFDRDLWDTAMKLKMRVERPGLGPREYCEALGVVLLHELLRVQMGSPAPEPVVHGGLAAWQQKRVAEYLDEHLADDVPLATLAGLARLSPWHFSRAFRQSFGMPPHRYHVSRRIDHAKGLLANGSVSVTEVGLQLGFSGTSAFTATFRKFAGRTPTDFRRSLQ